MNPKRWRQIDDAFQRALGSSEADRDARLAAVCAGDESLRAEVMSLLDAGDEPGVLDAKIPELAADVFGITEGPDDEGPLLGGYHVIRRLGTGGMSDVYLALDPRLGRHVALKLLPGAWASDAERIDRFQQEARAASALNHPNIVTVYDVGHANERPFIATEFVDGETLRARMSRGMAPREAVGIAVQIASALAATHHAGIVHRDIKPENVMLRADGMIKVLDFGLAKLPRRAADPAGRAATIPGMVFGTTPYMSPEQAQGLSLDGRSDIFSLGTVLFEMVSGRVPFTGDTSAATIASILRDQPAPVGEAAGDMAADLDRIIGRALRKNRGDRYQRAEDLLADLRSLCEQRAQMRATMPTLLRLRSSPRTIGALAIAAALSVAGIVSHHAWTRDAVEAAPATADHTRAAHQMVVKGRYFWNKRTIASLTTAIGYFEEALKLDPNYAAAFAGLGDAHIALGTNPGSPRPSREYLSRAKDAALKAVQLDPRAAQAHVTLAMVHHLLDWDWTGAEREFKRALELDSRLPEAYQRYGIYLAFMHRFDEATAALERAEELDPVSLAISTDLGVVHNFARRPDSAILQLHKALEIDPTYARARFELVAAYTLQEKYGAAFDELDHMKTGWTLPAARVAYDRQAALAGRPTNTRQLLAELVEESQRRYIPPTAIAELYAALDQRDEAFRWLNAAFEERSSLLLRVFVDPRWERYSIYRDSRFAELRRRIGL